MEKTEAFLALEEAAAERVLVLDGSVGVMIQERGLGEEAYRAGPLAGHPTELRGDSDALCLGSPRIVYDIHRAYLEAGADILTTNSFTATSLGQSHYGLAARAPEIAASAARIARAAADDWMEARPGRRRFVAGSMGPTGVSLSMRGASGGAGPAVGFRELSAAYREEAEALLDGGADLLLLETVFDALNAKAAICAILSIFEERGRRWPVIVSGTIVDRAGRSLSGQTPLAFLASVSHVRPFAVGLNCSFGADALLPRLEELAAGPFRLSVHPNAGLPNAEGGYDETPERFARAIAAFARRTGLNVAGGCCGTRPEHIAALAAALEGVAPRPPRPPRRSALLSGLEQLEIGPGSLFVNVGERTNVSGSRKFARLVREGDWDGALDVARDQVVSGAQMIDVNMDDPLLDSAQAMGEFLGRAGAEPDIARVPVMIDASDFATALAGLERTQGRCVVNSISLKEGEGPFLQKAREIAKRGAAVVVMAFDEAGQAATLDRRVSILERAYRLLVEEVGFEGPDIILDPNVFAIGTGIAEHRSYAADFIEAARRLKAGLPGVLVSGGVSNVSFAFRGNDALREAMHTVFLYHAKAAGMDLGIVNPAALGVYDEVGPSLRELIEDLLLDRRPDATERLVEAASASRAEGGADPGTGSGRAEPPWRALPVGERLAHALVAGVSSWIGADAEEAYAAEGSAYAVISGPLMKGMDRVGELFSEGRMFLPQVVKSARVMKEAVDLLMPRLEAEGGKAASRGRLVLATVKGDVHDIGKNIAAVVLRCNGYEVVDLGVMVPGDDILDAAEREGADAIGLSGLISPSLEEMVRVARAMEGRGMRIPLLVGGAATSPAHTAVAIAPAYSGPVAVVRDASRAAGVLGRLLDPVARPAYEAELAAAHEALRAARQARRESAPRLSLAEARSRAPAPAGPGYRPPEPRLRGVVELRPALRDLLPFVDWKFFFYEWGLKEGYPALLDDPARGPEASSLKSDAEAALARLGSRGVRAAALCAVLPAASDGDDAIVYEEGPGRAERARFRFLRQQMPKRDGSPSLCLADYLAPARGAREGGGGAPPDWLGLFAVTAGVSFGEEAARLSAAGDEYGAFMHKILGDRIAEAAAEWVHAELRRRIWGYSPDEGLSPADCLAGRYRGIRPAPGYPSCPDHRDKETILSLLGAGERIGIALTDGYMMEPEPSVSGFCFSRPEAAYFAVGRIGRDQLEDYAARRGESVADSEKRLRECIE
jgi:5-methyltetrahydrofolate--homocysteine methyltransferase